MPARAEICSAVRGVPERREMIFLRTVSFRSGGAIDFSGPVMESPLPSRPRFLGEKRSPPDSIRTLFIVSCEGVPQSEQCTEPGSQGDAGGVDEAAGTLLIHLRDAGEECPPEGGDCVEQNRQRAGAGRERSVAEAPREPRSPS